LPILPFGALDSGRMAEGRNEESAVVTLLRRNDPSVSEIRIVLSEHEDADGLVRALEQNEYITGLELFFGGVDASSTQWGRLLRVMASRVSLKAIRLTDSVEPPQRVPPTFLLPFLHAIQQNRSIKYVSFRRLRISGDDIASFLDTAYTLVEVHICTCELAPAGRRQGVGALAAALQRNTNIQILALSKLDDAVFLPILHGLQQSNTTLTGLKVSPVGTASCSAIRSFLEHTSSVKVLVLSGIFTVDKFYPIAQGLLSSDCITDIRFHKCLFTHEGSALLFRDIVQTKQNVHSLDIWDLYFRNVGNFGLHEILISILSRPSSPLRKFRLEFTNEPRLNLANVFTNDQFVSILEAVAGSKLQRFYVGDINSEPFFQAFTGIVPKLQVEELGFSIQFQGERAREQLLQSIKRNSSLRKVTSRGLIRSGGATEKKVEHYMVRNSCMAEWIENPTTIPERVWFRALHKASEMQPDVLYRALHAIAREISTAKTTRKRKRPQFYVPS